MLLLSMKTGWSREEILALPPHEFSYHVSRIIKAMKPRNE